jgi:hypothetical protein
MVVSLVLALHEATGVLFSHFGSAADQDHVALSSPWLRFETLVVVIAERSQSSPFLRFDRPRGVAVGSGPLRRHTFPKGLGASRNSEMLAALQMGPGAAASRAGDGRVAATGERVATS